MNDSGSLVCVSIVHTAVVSVSVVFFSAVVSIPVVFFSAIVPVSVAFFSAAVSIPVVFFSAVVSISVAFFSAVVSIAVVFYNDRLYISGFLLWSFIYVVLLLSLVHRSFLIQLFAYNLIVLGCYLLRNNDLECYLLRNNDLECFREFAKCVLNPDDILLWGSIQKL